MKRQIIILLGLLFVGVASALSEPRVLQEGRLGEYDYAHRASVAIAQDKIFIAASVHMQGEANPLAKVYLWSSIDKGGTWSSPEKLSEGPFDDVGAGLCVTRTGAVLLNYSTSLKWALDGDIKNPSHLNWWNQVKKMSLIEVNGQVDFWMRRSSDGGKSWSKPYEIPCNPLAGAEQLEDGSLFMFGHRVTDSIRQMIDGERNNFILTNAVSKDDGMTWSRIKDLGGVDGDGLISSSLHETGYAENKNHQVVVVMRNPFSADKAELKQFEVQEGDGKKWSAARKIGSARSFQVTSLKDDRLLMSYIDKEKATKLLARISPDGGKTWEEAGTIVADKLEIHPGFSSAALDDGSIVTVWFERVNDGSLRLCYRLWSL